MLWRGLWRRCPWCGDRRAYFVGWFTRREACRACGTPWRRSDVGFELGALTVMTILTFGALLVAATVAMILTAPDIAVVPIVVASIAVAIVLPILIYPSSYTIWQAMDLAMRPPAPGELASEPVRGRRRPHA